MKIELWAIRKTGDSYLVEGMKEYIKRLGNYCTFTYREIDDKRLKGTLQKENIKKIEDKAVSKLLTDSDYLILLDAVGKAYTSEAFSQWIAKLTMMGRKRYIFLIGGPYGFTDNIYTRANAKLSLSPMTFSHQMVRIFILEQLYRAFTILKNQKYHH